MKNHQSAFGVTRIIARLTVFSFAFAPLCRAAEPEVVMDGLTGPENLARDAEGNLWITDTDHLWRLDPAGKRELFYTRDPAADGTSLCGVSPGPGGMIHFSAGNRILLLDPADGSVRERAGGFKLANGNCMDDAGNLFIADSTLRELWVIPAGTSEARVLKKRAGWVNGLVWSRAGNTLYCSFSIPAKIVAWTLNDQLEITGEREVATFEKSGLDDFTLDADGNLIICLYSNDKVVRLKADGTRETLLENISGPSAVEIGRGAHAGRLLICEKGGKLKFDGTRLLAIPTDARPYDHPFQTPAKSSE